MSTNVTNAKATSAKATSAKATSAKATSAEKPTTLEDAILLIEKAERQNEMADRIAINTIIAIGNVLVSDARPTAFVALAQATMKAEKEKNRAALARFSRMERLIYFGVFCQTFYHEGKNSAVAYRKAICQDPLQHSFFLNGLPKDKENLRDFRQRIRENWNSFRPMLKDKNFNLWQDPIKLESRSHKRSAEERGKDLGVKLAAFLKAENMKLCEFVELYMSEK